jgi:hypothetical protein
MLYVASVHSFLSCSMNCVGSFLTALSGYVVYAVIYVQYDVLCGFH